MGSTSALIESVLETRFAVPPPLARWGTDGNQWLFSVHRAWFKLDITGEGTGDLLVLTCPVGAPPSRNEGRFHAILLAKNFHLPGPSLWCREGLFGLREVRYIDGLEELELVDMIELMAEVSSEVAEEMVVFKGDGLQILGQRDERAVQRVALSLGFGL